jgi:hypothetical protein
MGHALRPCIVALVGTHGPRAMGHALRPCIVALVGCHASSMHACVRCHALAHLRCDVPGTHLHRLLPRGCWNLAAWPRRRAHRYINVRETSASHQQRFVGVRWRAHPVHDHRVHCQWVSHHCSTRAHTEDSGECANARSGGRGHRANGVKNRR